MVRQKIAHLFQAELDRIFQESLKKVRSYVDAGGGPGIPEQGGTGSGPSGKGPEGGHSSQGKDPGAE